MLPIALDEQPGPAQRRAVVDIDVHQARSRAASSTGSVRTHHGLPAARGMVLTMGGYVGTLAAARDLGRHGIPVVLAERDPQTVTGHSRFVSRRLRCPGTDAPGQLAQWLLDFGEREPGHVLYPTSDDICWLMDRHRDALGRHYHLYQPPQGRIYEMLNKRRLHEHCRSLGIDQPVQWTPTKALAGPPELRYPVLIKPQTQAGMRVEMKGQIAQDAVELRAGLQKFSGNAAYRPEMLSHDPGVGEPIVQAFHPEAAEHIYSLAGFYAPEEDIYLLRASQKVLQQPMRIGVGLCFESRPIEPGPELQLRRLMDALGYCGAFEAEFIHLEAEGRFLLIDFNTRFYGQMGFEVARGLPIPRLCFLAAAGDWIGVRALAQSARQWDHGTRWRFRNEWMLRLFVGTHRLGGNLTRAQRRQWLEWADSAPHEDPIVARDDPAPARISRRQSWLSLVRHPRSTLRMYFRR